MLAPTDIAAAFGVHPRTVQRWVLSGRLRAHRMGGVRSRIRIQDDDFAEFMRGQRGLDVFCRALADGRLIADLDTPTPFPR